MPARYAETTSVSPGESRAAIERIVTNHGATAFGYAQQDDRARIMFEMHSRRIVFEVRLPDRNAREFTHTRHAEQWNQRKLSAGGAAERYDQAIRQRWRALYLVIRAKIEAIESGVETFEEAFLAHIQLPSGETVGEATAPAIVAAYAGEPMPALLPGTTR